jgi:hypothetical protein
MYHRRRIRAVAVAVAFFSAVAIVGTSPAQATSNPIEPVPTGSANAVFQIHPRYFPEIAQSIEVDSNSTFSKVEFRIESMTRGLPEYFTLPETVREPYAIYYTSYDPVPAKSTLSVYRSLSTNVLGQNLDIRNGFELLTQVVSNEAITLGKTQSIKFTIPQKFVTGMYLITFRFEPTDTQIINLRMSGRQAGTQTRGGPNHDLDKTCTYTPSADTYSSGRAYRGVGPAEEGFGSVFSEHDAKVSECSVKGVYVDIFNPGDLQIRLVDDSPLPATTTTTSTTTTSATYTANPTSIAAGKVCPKVGKTATIGNKNFLCVKNSPMVAKKTGKVRVWVRVIGTSPTTTTTTIPTTISLSAINTRLSAIASEMRKRSNPIPVVEYNYSATVPSEFRQLTQAQVEAFFKYGDFPGFSNYPFRVFVGTTSSELRNLITSAGCDGFSNNTTEIYNGYFPCKGRANIHIRIMPDRGGGWNTPNLLQGIAHELSHGGKMMLLGCDPIAPNYCLNQLPAWFATGVSNIYASAIAAALTNTDYKNYNIAPGEAMRCENSPIEKETTTRSDCVGSGTGDFAGELLVARFGFAKVWQFNKALKDFPPRSEWPLTGGAWEKEFSTIFLQSPSSFSKDVETFRQAVISGGTLPIDFLEMKTRQ